MDRHHIIPQYMDGSNSADNIIKVTRTQHVMWHYANWKLWGNTEDFIAYRGLAGTIPGHEIAQEVRSMNARRHSKNQTGIFALSKEEKMANSSKGGTKGGKQMKDYIWITDGESNTRIRKEISMPKGWVSGVTRKKRAEPKIKKFESVEKWNEFQKVHSLKLIKTRLRDLETVDLTKWGAITRLSELWGISCSQVRRYLPKIMSFTDEQ